MDTQEQLSFETQPVIKGFPELRWTGKRPYRSTLYYPAQLKESYGQPVDGWMNKIFWGDNLQVMSHLLRDYRGRINLIYIDPPFDSKADYKKKITLKGKNLTGDTLAFEEKQYADIWSSDEYLQFMYERLILMRELLSDNGSLFLHCDWRRSHHLRCLLDEVFGPNCFQAQIAWRAMTSSGYKGKSSLGRSHADILYYSKSPDKSRIIYNPFFLPLSENMRKRYVHRDPDGRLYKDSNLGNVSPETVEELRKQNLLYITSNGTPRIKHYLDEAQGTRADDVWDDIPFDDDELVADDLWTDINTTNSQSNLQTGYPTQKPEELLERIISIASNPGDIVFDCFMGSGTTQAVAMRLGRRFLGADINLGSIQTTSKRLLTVARKVEADDTSNTVYTGFELYNVNNYDFFRNPIEARDLLVQALDIQPFAAGHTYDGELDGRMVKILPTNRIASKADLEDFVASLPYAQFDTRKDENPSEPVERITLVCMGHEPDLKAALEQQLDEYIVDIRVMDVLRDRSDLQLKREAEADVAITDGKLIIKGFWPMNLLQKLSMERESVEDWREMVESVLIDWNYDGAVMEPSVIDIPEDKNGLVSGVYDVPEGAGTVCVKITDVLSESLEVEVRA